MNILKANLWLRSTCTNHHFWWQLIVLATLLPSLPRIQGEIVISFIAKEECVKRLWREREREKERKKSNWLLGCQRLTQSFLSWKHPKHEAIGLALSLQQSMAYDGVFGRVNGLTQTLLVSACLLEGAWWKLMPPFLLLSPFPFMPLEMAFFFQREGTCFGPGPPHKMAWCTHACPRDMLRDFENFY